MGMFRQLTISVSSFPRYSLPSFRMTHGRKSDEWMHKVNESQRNTVFPDTARNLGGFWGGIYKQRLNAAQSVGLLILVVFYVVLMVRLVAERWPGGEEPFWQKILYGYGPYLLLSLPVVFFFLALHWRMRRSKQTHGRSRVVAPCRGAPSSEIPFGTCG
jgi:hypothetical protein